MPSQASAESTVVDTTDLLDRSFLVFLVELTDRMNDLCKNAYSMNQGFCE